MIEYVELMARYNSSANRKLYEIAGKLPEETIKKDVGAYYHSVFGLMNHILAGDLLWMDRFRKVFTEHKSLKTDILEFDIRTFKTGLYSELPPLVKRREAVDSVFIEWSHELAEEDLKRPIEYKNILGQSFRLIVWQTLAHLFNHQTHHRGCISLIFDQLGMENDYSGITNIL